ncbi:hypothetical protein ACH42_01890 [Endozoicomonas sp. (ex Bugula neritina AB1)]|nr:hypothetical protein ACH42_01890 [Endozoicomonas sp. (ex Bugula neritina AB1)]
MFEAVELPEDKSSFYRLLSQQAQALMSGEKDALANLANISSLINVSMADLNWVGFYIMRGEHLVLGPFQGKPACVHIPVGRGVCGTAVIEMKTQRVDDVCAFPGHIACDVASQSELVVPIIVNERVVAVLDIDSPIASRFDEDDQSGVELLVDTLSKTVEFDQLLY